VVGDEMKFDDLFAYALKPFSDYITVVKAKQIGLIPKKFESVFPDVCICGSDMMARINDGSVTAVTCCDPGCYVKLGYQAAEVFSKYGYKGIGANTCKKLVSSVVNKNGSAKLYDILVDGLYYNELGEFVEEELTEAINIIRTSKVSFGKFVARLCYPFIGDKFDDVLSGVSSFEELIDRIYTGGGILNFFSQRGVRDLNVIFCFAFFANDIGKLCSEFSDSIIASSENKVPVCMTGRMNTSIGILTKSDFLEKCNLLVMKDDGKKDFDIISVEAVRKAAFVIVGEDSRARGTSKFKTARELEYQLRESGEFGPDEKFVFSPDEFFQYLLKGDGIGGGITQGS
jgi:hypothetical protein